MKTISVLKEISLLGESKVRLF